MTSTKSRTRILLMMIPLVFVLDQVTKYLVVSGIPLNSSIPIISGIFDLVHTRNRGAAFGFMANLPDSVRLPFFFVVSLTALTLITVYFFRMKEERRLPFIFLAMILGGACGNIWDRIFLGEVVDFLSFHWYGQTWRWQLLGMRGSLRLEWPAFNVADMAISISVFGLMVFMFFKKEEKEAS